MAHDAIVQYWIDTAEDDYASMQRIFATEEYVWALFIGHLVIEKLLKACCARTLGREVPRTHNLVRLVSLAGLDITDAREEMLSRLMLYQIGTRYPDWRRQFRQAVNRERAQRDLAALRELRQWLLQVLSEQSNQ